MLARAHNNRLNRHLELVAVHGSWMLNAWGTKTTADRLLGRRAFQSDDVDDVKTRLRRRDLQYQQELLEQREEQRRRRREKKGQGRG